MHHCYTPTSLSCHTTSMGASSFAASTALLNAVVINNLLNDSKPFNVKNLRLHLAALPALVKNPGVVTIDSEETRAKLTAATDSAKVAAQKTAGTILLAMPTEGPAKQDFAGLEGWQRFKTRLARLLTFGLLGNPFNVAAMGDNEHEQAMKIASDNLESVRALVKDLAEGRPGLGDKKLGRDAFLGDALLFAMKSERASRRVDNTLEDEFDTDLRHLNDADTKLTSNVAGRFASYAVMSRVRDVCRDLMAGGGDDYVGGAVDGVTIGRDHWLAKAYTRALLEPLYDSLDEACDHDLSKPQNVLLPNAAPGL